MNLQGKKVIKPRPAFGAVFLKVLLIIVVCLGVVRPPPAQAAESGTGVYLLGYQSSMAGFLPPPGFYLRNDFYIYEGIAEVLPLSGLLEANLRLVIFSI